MAGSIAIALVRRKRKKWNFFTEIDMLSTLQYLFKSSIDCSNIPIYQEK